MARRKEHQEHQSPSDLKERVKKLRVSGHLSPRRCRHCGTSFVPKRRDQVYCKTACRRIDQYKPVSIEKECDNCGGLFSTTSPLKTHYCDRPECVEDRKSKKTILVIEVTVDTGVVYTLDIKEGAQYQLNTPSKIMIRKEVIKAIG